jgi:hypothetical protein
MGWFSRRRAAAPEGRAEQRAEVNRVREHLEQFVQTRRGVEAFVEPATTMNPPTVLLIASTGEWTRRRVPHPGVLRDLSERLMIPVYDIQQVGYPQRMRDWNARAKRGEPQPVEDIELPPWPG